MKTWHIFAIGTAGMIASLVLVPFIAYVAVMVAVLMIAAVVLGFLLVPDRDSWQVWVERYDLFEGEEDDLDFYSTKEPLAISADVARLWILYIPTIAAVAFLIFMAARDVWVIDPGILNPTGDVSYIVLMAARVGIALVWLLLGGWVFERWLLWRAGAAQAYEQRPDEDHFVPYYFVVDKEYYGGVCFPLSADREEPELASVVMHRRNDPQRNRLLRAFIFHRFKVIARGVQDLEHARQLALQPSSEHLE